MQLFIFLDNYIIFLNFVFTGSILGLLIAYVIKAYALANTSIESGYIRISPYMEDIAKTLTASNFKILFQVHLPLLKTSFLTSALLVISEVIKELPATLILRPFNLILWRFQHTFMPLKKECMKLQHHQLQLFL